MKFAIASTIAICIVFLLSDGTMECKCFTTKPAQTTTRTHQAPPRLIRQARRATY